MLACLLVFAVQKEKCAASCPHTPTLRLPRASFQHFAPPFLARAPLHSPDAKRQSISQALHFVCVCVLVFCFANHYLTQRNAPFARATTIYRVLTRRTLSSLVTQHWTIDLDAHIGLNAILGRLALVGRGARPEPPNAR